MKEVLVNYGGIITYVTNNKAAVYAAIEEDLKGEFPDFVYAIDLLLELESNGIHEIIPNLLS